MLDRGDLVGREGESREGEEIASGGHDREGLAATEDADIISRHVIATVLRARIVDILVGDGATEGAIAGAAETIWVVVDRAHAGVGDRIHRQRETERDAETRESRQRAVLGESSREVDVGRREVEDTIDHVDRAIASLVDMLGGKPDRFVWAGLEDTEGDGDRVDERVEPLTGPVLGDPVAEATVVVEWSAIEVRVDSRLEPVDSLL